MPRSGLLLRHRATLTQSGGANPPEKLPGTLHDLPRIEDTTMKLLIASTRPSRLLATAIVGALTLTCAAASIADDKGSVPQVVVRFGDISVTSPPGAAALYGRIVVAAYEVCKSFDVDIHGNTVLAQRDACVHKAILHAVTQVGHPELLAIYNARYSEHLPITAAAMRAETALLRRPLKAGE